MQESDDPFTFAQAHHFMAIACLYNHGLLRGTYHHKIAVATIKRHNIRFAPSAHGSSSYDSTVFSEGVHERAVFLAQVVYSEINQRLFAGEQEDPDLDLESQFRYELPVRIFPS